MKHAIKHKNVSAGFKYKFNAYIPDLGSAQTTVLLRLGKVQYKLQFQHF